MSLKIRDSGLVVMVTMLGLAILLGLGLALGILLSSP